MESDSDNVIKYEIVNMNSKNFEVSDLEENPYLPPKYGEYLFPLDVFLKYPLGTKDSGNLLHDTSKDIQEIQYKYKENLIIEEFKNYIDSTYRQHYMTDDNIQCFDAWIALGNAQTSFRDTAMKYLWRNGNKGNEEDFKKDLLKAMHYVLMQLYMLERNKE